MKKALAVVLLLCAGWAHAGIFDYGAEKTVYVKYDLAVTATSTSTVLVDRSDTTNWPHKHAGSIRIVGLDVNVDKAAASTTTVKIGVVNFINASTGSITWVWEKSHLTNVSNTDVNANPHFFPIPINCKVEPANTADDGATPYVLSNDTTSGSSTYQNDSDLPSPNGDVSPGLGDLILFVQKPGTSTTATVNIHIWYYTDRR